MSSPRDRRLRGAFIFSLLCLIAVPWAAKALDVRLGPQDYEKALVMAVPALGLSLASVMASWLLVAALLERRPALMDRQGRWLWPWTFLFCSAFVALGLASSASQTLGQVSLYASGLLIALMGAVGLLVSALPHWRRRAAGR